MTETTKKPYNVVSLSDLPDSEKEIEVSIEPSALEKNWKKAVERISHHVSVDGFRKGHVPEKMIIEKIGEYAILEEAAEITISELYSDIVKEKNIDAIGRPSITIKKLAKGNPLEVTIKTAIMPKVTVGEYKDVLAKINVKKESIEVTPEDVAHIIEQLQKEKAKSENTEVLPELNDEFVATLGEFNDVEDFKVQIKKSLTQEKEIKAREKRRQELVDALVEKVDIAVPSILIESELDRMVSDFGRQIERMGLKVEDYLKNINKTVEDMRVEWHKDAIKRVKIQLSLHEIAQQEKIEPTKEEVEKELGHIKEHYPETDIVRATLYVAEMLTNEKVFQYLEALN